MQRIVIGLTGIVLVVFMAACASTSTPRSEPAQARVVTIPEYREFLTALDASIEQGEPRPLNTVEMENYLEASGRLRSLLGRYESVDAMPEAERLELFNLHETLQAVVIGKSEDQVMCRRVQTVGTHFRETRCMTHSEWQYRQEMAREYMSTKFQSWQLNPADYR